LDDLLRFIDGSDGWLVEFLLLVLVPFVHEDVAIFAAGLMNVEYGLPVELALCGLYAGMVASDLALYGIGAAARRNAWVQRRVLTSRIGRLGHWLGNHLMPTMVLARVVPGVMFPVYVAMGLSRVSFARFAGATMLTAAVYLPILLALVSGLGEQIRTEFQYSAWFVLAGIFVIALWVWARSPNWEVVFRVSVFGGGALMHRVTGGGRRLAGLSHRGMPELGGLGGRVSFAERIPPLLFYIPLVVQWLWLGIRRGSLSLPALANPHIEVGGLWGESKCAYFDMMQGNQRAWLAPYAGLTRGLNGSAAGDLKRALAAMAGAGLDFPVVAKPDIGWRGFGVRLAADRAALAAYIAAYPEGAKMILQQPVDWDGEAGVLYARLPGEERGRIVSLTLRYFPHVVGDGRTSLRDLILRDGRTAWKLAAHLGLDGMHLGAAESRFEQVPAEGETVRLSFIGSNRVGGLYADGRAYITEPLTERFDAIAKAMPEFYYGRFDVRFAAIERLAEGEDFSIIEINGAGGESINVWDPRMKLVQVYRELFYQQRLLFEIGARNRARGYRPPGVLALFRCQWRQQRLIAAYPPSS